LPNFTYVASFLEFDFDLWSSPADELVKKVTSDEWLEDETKRHNLKSNRKTQRKLPEDHHRITSKLPAVEVPHGGASYNPSLKDHQVDYSPSLFCLSFWT
jgi:Nop53 (60S ribosomal biogenesis)